SHIDKIDRVQARSGNTYTLVSWRVDNRPTNTNLVFEQVLPDGTLLNIELPRLFWWVNSAGIGFVNMVYPGDNFNTITLRLSVVNTAKDVLAYREVQIQIEDNLARPQIDSFYANVPDISLQQLRTGNARIEVGWFTSNRTEQMNLVFEQVLPNSQVVNVELPRPNSWVNSEGSGITAPIYPGDGVAHVHLQVRLYLLNSGETLDTRTIFVPIQEYIQAPAPTPTRATSEPVINHFTVTPSSANEGDLLTISWDVSGLNTVSMAVSFPNASQPLQQFLNENNIGTKTVNAPYGAREVIFLIYANDTLRDPLHSVTIALNCRFTWMGGHSSSEYCPEAEPQTAQAAYQAFERGYMVWHVDSANTTKIVWIYINETGAFTTKPDFYAGETLLFDETPPAGLYQPINGFGK
ncbi:MAG TPA: hypothetical protein PLZ51_02365, partial [Aggregatilineales bacterium]|nr:hypothetical protein [Aggregatilineales bacterium]